jgi:hypothetical protein
MTLKLVNMPSRVDFQIAKPMDSAPNFEYVREPSNGQVGQKWQFWLVNNVYVVGYNEAIKP